MYNMDLKSQLDARQLAIAQSEMENYRKSTGAAYLLWFFLGGFGVHRFYIDRVGTGVIMLTLELLGWMTIWIFGLGLIFLIPNWIWWIVDAFLLHGYVQNINIAKEREILIRVSRNNAIVS
ncbi:TM2 domain-containing protein [Desmospora activa]|uniref:TM2 domain-containing membrane protein YozV n=1 Tax=Desmospora activa DSM 45169 TaxID=1121389 RepID=A0A2T4Z3N6_9BACL|nr:TM2 domain-containing protein [Desmospora activa]PTM56505.1 TM2 domain-containing membrane protein YozV [Desmospora activa DSM 45169]